MIKPLFYKKKTFILVIKPLFQKRKPLKKNLYFWKSELTAWIQGILWHFRLKRIYSLLSILQPGKLHILTVVLWVPQRKYLPKCVYFRVTVFGVKLILLCSIFGILNKPPTRVVSFTHTRWNVFLLKVCTPWDHFGTFFTGPSPGKVKACQNLPNPCPIKMKIIVS